MSMFVADSCVVCRPTAMFSEIWSPKEGEWMCEYCGSTECVAYIYDGIRSRFLLKISQSFEHTLYTRESTLGHMWIFFCEPHLHDLCTRRRWTTRLQCHTSHSEFLLRKSRETCATQQVRRPSHTLKYLRSRVNAHAILDFEWNEKAAFFTIMRIFVFLFCFGGFIAMVVVLHIFSVLFPSRLSQLRKNIIT